MKTEIIYGIHPVFEALAAEKRTFYDLFQMQGKNNRRTDEITARAEAAGIAVHVLSRQKLAALCGADTHQGMAARVSPCPLLSLNEILSNASASTSADTSAGFLLILDNIVDPYNLGALIRSALCTGVTGVVIPRDRSAPPSPAVSKASAGALEHICLASVVNLATTLKELKKHGYWIIGLDMGGGQSIYENDFTGNIVLVVGGEGTGIRPLVKQHCDFLRSIPQTGPVSSLNASVAGAVAMYEVYRQRHLTGAT